MDFRKMMMACALLIASCCLQAQTKVIAHRGFWKTPGSSQNGITALQKADSIGCYGSEFDVWLAKDNKLVVNHDPVFKMKFMEKNTTKLVLELKAHRNTKRETKAVQEIIAMVKRMGLEKRMEYISFSLHATKEFIRLAPAGTPVFYLNGDLSPKELKEIGCTGPDYQLGVFRKNPEWIKECHDLNMKVNVWTVDKAEDMEWLIEKKVDFITTNEPVVLLNLLKK